MYTWLSFVNIKNISIKYIHLTNPILYCILEYINRIQTIQTFILRLLLIYYKIKERIKGYGKRGDAV